MRRLPLLGWRNCGSRKRPRIGAARPVQRGRAAPAYERPAPPGPAPGAAVTLARPRLVPMRSPLPAPVRPRYAWLDWLSGSDPGLNRLRLAVQVVVTVGVAIAAEWIFVLATRALLLPTVGLPAQAVALVDLRNHGV